MISELSEVQAKILECLINHKKSDDDDESLPNGLTSYRINNTDQTLVKRAVEYNLPKLVLNYYIKITKEETKNGKKWRHYNITSLGLLAFLKYLIKGKRKKRFKIKKLAHHFPLIISYWDELLSIHENELLIALKKAINGIEVSPQDNDYLVGKFYELQMKIDVKPRQDSLHALYSISIIDYFLFPNDRKEFDDFIEFELGKIYNNIQNKITFLTYYYLIQNYLGPLRPLERLEELDVERKRLKTIEQDDLVDILKIKREKRKISKKIKHVISIIHSDPELKQLFINMNLEFEKKFQSPFLLKDVILKKLKL